MITNIEQALTEAINSALKARKLEFELPQSWRNAVSSILRSASPGTLQITTVDFVSIVEKLAVENWDLSYWDFATLNNFLETKSCSDLNYCSLESYLDLLREVDILATKWNQVAGPLQQKIIDELMKAQKVDALKARQMRPVAQA